MLVTIGGVVVFNAVVAGSERAPTTMNRAARAFREIKYSDEAATTQTLAADAGLNLGVALPDQGNTAQTRVGQKFLVTSLEVDAVIVPGVEEGSLTPSDRCQVFYFGIFNDKQHNSTTQPAITDIYQFNSAAPGAFRDLDNTTRFQVLMFKTIILSPTMIGSIAGNDSDYYYPTVHLHYYKKFAKPILVEVAAGTTTTAVGNVDRNYMWASILNHDVSFASAQTANVAMRSRIRFLD